MFGRVGENAADGFRDPPCDEAYELYLPVCTLMDTPRMHPGIDVVSSIFESNFINFSYLFIYFS